MAKSLNKAIEFAEIGLKNSCWPMMLSHFLSRKEKYDTVLDILIKNTTEADSSLRYIAISDYLVNLCSALERFFVDLVWRALNDCYECMKDGKINQDTFSSVCTTICGGQKIERIISQLKESKNPLLALSFVASCQSCKDINKALTPIWNTLMDDEIEEFTKELPNITKKYSSKYFLPFLVKDILKNPFLIDSDPTKLEKCLMGFFEIRNNFLHKSEYPESIKERSDSDYYLRGVAFFVVAAFFALTFAGDECKRKKITL